MSTTTVEALLEENRQLKEALAVASAALFIVGDWHFPALQANPPAHWNLPGGGEDPADGWCSTDALANYLKQLAGPANAQKSNNGQA